MIWGGQPCCFLLDCILAITCQVLQCRSQVEGLKGFEDGAVCPRGEPFTTLYDTELYFIKVRIVDAALKVVAGEIRPSGGFTRSAGWENVFLFKLNPLESNHFFSSSFYFILFFFLGETIQSDVRHQLSKEGFTIYLCWFYFFYFSWWTLFYVTTKPSDFRLLLKHFLISKSKLSV